MHLKHLVLFNQAWALQRCSNVRYSDGRFSPFTHAPEDQMEQELSKLEIHQRS